MDLIHIALLVFLAVYLALKGITTRTGQEKDDIVARVRKYTKDIDSQTDANGNKKKKSLLAVFSAILRLLMPNRILENVESELVQADIPFKAEEMVGLTVAASIIPGVLSLLLFQNIVLSLLLAVLGAYLPLVYIKTAKSRRTQKFNNQLGDALLIMANSLRAGFSFLQTMDSISKEMAPPMSKEFSRTLREMRLGTTTEDALRNMADRIKSEDMELIVTAVTIQRQVGGNLAQILDNIAFTISERVRIKAEIRTLTAQGRISGTIVALLPLFLAVMISIMNPAYMAILIRHPVGWMLIAGAIISEFIGIMAIKKIVNIEL